MQMTTEEKVMVKKSIQEMIDSMTRTAAERDLQKNIVARIKEETTVTPKVFRRMARVAFSANYMEEKQNNEEFENLYEEVSING